MEPVFFAKPVDFRNWLEENYQKEKELLVGYYKVKSGKESMTWPESVDEALCFGWIDGIRRTIDEASYSIRFTPRRPDSIWSAVNIKKIEELTAKGLMKPAGLAAFEKRKGSKSKIYIHENEPLILNQEYEKQFRANEKAWSFFEKQPPYYRKVSIGWVMGAKQEKTRISRLEKLINASESGKRL